jgi:hypothetical protein
LDPGDATQGEDTYMSADFSIACDSSRYASGVSWAVIMLFVYPVGLPCFYAWQLYRVKALISTRDEVLYQQDGEGLVLQDDSGARMVDTNKTQRRDDALGHFDFLFCQYKPKFWYWEVVEILRKVFLCGWLVVFGHGTTLQVILGVSFNLVFIKIYALFEPYRDVEASGTAECSIWQVFGIYFIALLLRDDSFSNSRSTDLDVVLMAIIVSGLIMEIFIIWRRRFPRSSTIESYTVTEEVREQKRLDMAVTKTSKSESKDDRSTKGSDKCLEMTVLEDHSEEDQALEELKAKPTTSGSSHSSAPSSGKVYPVTEDDAIVDDDELEGEELPPSTLFDDGDDDDDDDDDDNVLMC